jgi:hypothetical protein
MTKISAKSCPILTNKELFFAPAEATFTKKKKKKNNLMKAK